MPVIEISEVSKDNPYLLSTRTEKIDSLIEEYKEIVETSKQAIADLERLHILPPGIHKLVQMSVRRGEVVKSLLVELIPFSEVLTRLGTEEPSSD